ncbi:MAG: RtcB family protein [Anaerolineaceae bacterium]|jgi:tRNA-splicing ligase RtcB|nr:MAG: RtcB family protein [Anaerolineaceae bacterium]
MVKFDDLKKITEFEWLIPSTYRSGMQADVRIIASQAILKKCMDDLSLEQAVNATFLPGLVGEVLVMPDVHQGYGFPIGGVAATDAQTGVISPGAIGYDINCGVRLLSSRVEIDEVRSVINDLLQALYTAIPSGLGRGGLPDVHKKHLEKILVEGAEWARQNGYAASEDLNLTEDRGKIANADPSKVSRRALERGLEQVGSLGAGNHFIEVSIVDEIFHPTAARAMGITENCLCLMIHSGSRGLGHQICTDYVQQFQQIQKKYAYALPDRELGCAPLQSKEGQAYLAAMRCAANYAFCNRQVMAHLAREAFERALSAKCRKPYLQMVYDLAHNIGKIEDHIIGKTKKQVCVHRKGATRAFGPGEPDVPTEYMEIGQPVLIPGSMGTSSWVLVGKTQAMVKTFGSSCHGAGRMYSRKSARKLVRGDQIVKDLHEKGIEVMAGSLGGLAEEAPHVYKDVDEVVECVVQAGIVEKVARLRPIAVIKG